MLQFSRQTDKIELFEEFLLLMVDWFCESHNIKREQFNSHDRNDLSKLKVIKLHFFAVSTSIAAIEKFDSFHAMPYGHVESDIYSRISYLTYFEVNSRNLQIKDIETLSDIDPSPLTKGMVQGVKLQNENLINYSAFELVELSHKWFSWRKTYNEATSGKTYSKKINSEIIKNEYKYYV